MRVILELLRILLIFVLGGALLGSLIKMFYSVLNINMETHGMLAMIGVYIFLFILYRNKWQFAGWYKGKGREKLPKRVTQILSLCVALFILSPILLSILK
ncbi:hypothetical protein ACFYKX_05355 [Cytobacillus sp. FJAT-54145]|uniref:DUF3899 domain-containing protein n=1 Tax=Cytobacillus spartinae TaxID=3299023 RepID=A0ABW6K772_9BACI